MLAIYLWKHWEDILWLVLTSSSQSARILPTTLRLATLRLRFLGFVPVIAPQSVLLVSHTDRFHYSQILEKAYTVLVRRPETQPKTPSTMNSPAYGYTADTLEKYIKAKEERFRVTGVRSTIVPVTRTGMEKEIKQILDVSTNHKMSSQCFHK